MPLILLMRFVLDRKKTIQNINVHMLQNHRIYNERKIRELSLNKPLLLNMCEVHCPLETMGKL